MLMRSVEADLDVMERAMTRWSSSDYVHLYQAITKIRTTFTSRDKDARRSVRDDLYEMREHILAAIEDVHALARSVREQLAVNEDLQVELAINPDGLVTDAYFLEPAAGEVAFPEGAGSESDDPGHPFCT
jgi:hypothetical protein